MKKYYEILNIPADDLIFQDPSDLIYSELINTKYINTISRYANLPFHTIKMIEEIKDIKEAYYVLNNKELKNKYDIKYKKTIDREKSIEPNVLFNKVNSTKVTETLDDTFDNTKIYDRLINFNQGENNYRPIVHSITKNKDYMDSTTIYKRLNSIN
jgi:hypothetical protein